MSHESYEKTVTTQGQTLQVLLKSEQKLNNEISVEQDRNNNAIDCRQKMANSIGTRFIKYIKIYKTLDEACDQIVQPQKVEIMRRLLQSVIGRILSSKTTHPHDYHLFDQLLIDNKLTPQDISLHTPRPNFDPYNNERSKQYEVKSMINESVELACNYQARYLDSNQVIIDDQQMLSYEAIGLL